MTNHKDEGSTNSTSYKKEEYKRSKKTGSKSKKGKTATTITKKDNKQTLDQQITANMTITTTTDTYDNVQQTFTPSTTKHYHDAKLQDFYYVKKTGN
ncbi:hypothetical protein RFI_37318, partial [Reticulomyxa filosa]